MCFGYFLFSADKNQGKKLYSGANLIMFVIMSTVLLIDLLLRVVAFKDTYCLGSADQAAFAACKEEHQ